VALERYRQKAGLPAKLISVATAANEYSIADGPGTLNVCGFDAAVPNIIADFATHNF
jgi:60 kDa SS-A/Ro ribonucleoprotein